MPSPWWPVCSVRDEHGKYKRNASQEDKPEGETWSGYDRSPKADGCRNHRKAELEKVQYLEPAIRAHCRRTRVDNRTGTSEDIPAHCVQEIPFESSHEDDDGNKQRRA